MALLVFVGVLGETLSTKPPPSRISPYPHRDGCLAAGDEWLTGIVLANHTRRGPGCSIFLFSTGRPEMLWKFGRGKITWPFPEKVLCSCQLWNVRSWRCAWELGMAVADYARIFGGDKYQMMVSCCFLYWYSYTPRYDGKRVDWKKPTDPLYPEFEIQCLLCTYLHFSFPCFRLPRGSVFLSFSFLLIFLRAVQSSCLGSLRLTGPKTNKQTNKQHCN